MLDHKKFWGLLPFAKIGRCMSLTFPRMGTTCASTPLRWGVNCKASNIVDIDQISNLSNNVKATHKVFANKSKTNHQMMQSLQEFEPWLEELNLTLRDGGIFLPSSATDNWWIKNQEWGSFRVSKTKKKERVLDTQLSIKEKKHSSLNFQLPQNVQPSIYHLVMKRTKHSPAKEK